MWQVPETEDSSRTRPAQTTDPQDAERIVPALKRPNRLWYSFAPHLLESGYGIRTVQELLGHNDVKTTMVYTHVLDRGGKGVKTAWTTCGGGA